MSEICPHCDQTIKMGQARLSRAEKTRFDWGSRDGYNPNIIEAQCVKAAAIYYGIEDWTAVWDPTLSIEENKDNMRQLGNSPAMREWAEREMRARQ